MQSPCENAALEPSSFWVASRHPCYRRLLVQACMSVGLKPRCTYFIKPPFRYTRALVDRFFYTQYRNFGACRKASMLLRAIYLPTYL